MTLSNYCNDKNGVIMEARNDAIDFLSLLPCEISMQILFFLEAKNLAKLSLVCKSWDEITTQYFSPFTFLLELQLTKGKEINNLLNVYKKTSNYLFTEGHIETDKVTAWEVLSYAMVTKDIKKIPIHQFQTAVELLNSHPSFNDNFKNSFLIMLTARKISNLMFQQESFRLLNKEFRDCLAKTHCYINLSGSILTRINLNKANLSGINFYHTKFYRSELNHVNLENANLKKADLRGARLREANLFSANLQKSNLITADFYKAKLAFSDLSYTKSKSAMLTCTDLSSANLTAADFAWAILTSSTFENTILENTLFFSRLSEFRISNLLTSIQSFETQFELSDPSFEVLQCAIAKDIIKLINEKFIDVGLFVEGKKILALIEANSFFQPNHAKNNIKNVFDDANAKIKKIEGQINDNSLVLSLRKN